MNGGSPGFFRIHRISSKVYRLGAFRYWVSNSGGATLCFWCVTQWRPKPQPQSLASVLSVSIPRCSKCLLGLAVMGFLLLDGFDGQRLVVVVEPKEIAERECSWFPATLGEPLENLVDGLVVADGP
jgi:hypothetical protein